MILMPECSLLRTYYKEKGNLFLVTCAGQAEGITMRGVFELFPLKGRVKWCWQPRCWDTAPSVFLWCGSIQKAIPSHPMKDAAQRQTEQQDVPRRG